MTITAPSTAAAALVIAIAGTTVAQSDESWTDQFGVEKGELARIVAGTETRVVEERESKRGVLVEVSRNYYAISKRTNSVYYFGEATDIYKDGKVVNHEGSWLAGANGARFGLMMPGTPLVGGRYYEEITPGVAMDRAQIVTVSAAKKVPAGLLQDESLELVRVEQQGQSR